MKKTVFLLTIMLILTVALCVSAQETPTVNGSEPRVYIVKEGDTLWSIAGEVYNDSNKWQLLLSLNPQITDPNALRPGDKLIIEETKPAEIKPVETAPVVEETPPVPSTIPEQPITYTEPPTTMVLPPVKTEDEFTMKPSDVYYVPKVLNAGFLTEKELEDSGTIDHTREEKRLLTDDNVVFIKLPKERLVALKRGDRFTIFRVAEKVKHPVTRKTVGYAVTIVGELEVTSIGAKTAAAIVTSANDIITIGDRVRPFEPTVTTIRVTKGRDPVVGYIVYTLLVEKYFMEEPLIAENDVVYIDRGYADGIRTGNIMDVLRIRDEYNDEELTAEEYQRMLESNASSDITVTDEIVYPPDIIGQIVVIKADEFTSTAVVNRSNSEIKLGDMVRLQIE